jgi:hypothetical protein
MRYAIALRLGEKPMEADDLEPRSLGVCPEAAPHVGRQIGRAVTKRKRRNLDAFIPQLGRRLADVSELPALE